MALLSILIPTLPERRESLCRLADVLRPQIQSRGRVAVLTLEDCGERTTGEKRQRLLESARTDYVAFVDDDDLVSADYVRLILRAIDDGPDVVGFRLRRYQDGVLEGVAVHSLSAARWKTERRPEGLTLYERTPNHLNPIRRELALSVGYRPMTVGEDADYSNRLYAAHGAVMREAFVDAYLYDYLCTSRPVGPAVPVTEWDEAGRLTRAGAEKAIAAGGSAYYGGRACRTLEELMAVSP